VVAGSGTTAQSGYLCVNPISDIPIGVLHLDRDISHRGITPRTGYLMHDKYDGSYESVVTIDENILFAIGHFIT
jgi:hypothetical protein